jgi:hypothetical protein
METSLLVFVSFNNLKVFWLVYNEWKCVNMCIIGRHDVHLERYTVGAFIQYGGGMKKSGIQDKLDYPPVLHLLFAIYNDQLN